MKTLYAACLSRLGLTQTEAALLHDVGLPTVKHWSTGRRPVPQGVWDDLRQYEAAIVEGAESMLEAWESADGPDISIDDSAAGGPSLVAAADFVLNTALGTLVHIGEDEATILARQARRPN